MSIFFFDSNKRGKSDLGWLQSRFSFSFADWYDPNLMGFGVLRVLNDDIIAPESGFGMHPHNNMEIITIVTRGTVSHKDSMGNDLEIKAGEIQVMSAGTGIIHSEFNKSYVEPLELFQIWILPKEKNIQPRYDQKSFVNLGDKNKWNLVVSGDKSHIDTLWINQDSYFSLGEFGPQKNLEVPKYNTSNLLFLFVIEGKIRINEQDLSSRDAVGFEGENPPIEVIENSKLLLIEVTRG